MQPRRIFKTTIAYLAILLLAGCAARGSIAPLIDNPVTTGPHIANHNIFVASTRQFSSDPADYFSSDRSNTLKFAKLSISVPTGKQFEAAVQWPFGKADPRIHFAKTEDVKFSGKGAFINSINRALATKTGGDKAIFIFIHGYNNTFTESLYRLAQLKRDACINAVTIAFSWPSKAKFTQYIHDRESVAFSRDKLEALLKTVANANTDKIYILAHSLGSWLTMETLRQTRIRKDPKNKLFKKLRALALAAPDIDTDVFKTQLDSVGKINGKFFLMTSQEDKVLGFLSRLTGNIQRVGRIRDQGALSKKYGIRFPLVEKSKGSDRSGHSTFATSTKFLKIFRNWVRVASGKKCVR